jgi:replicative DNA helicase
VINSPELEAGIINRIYYSGHDCTGLIEQLEVEDFTGHNNSQVFALIKAAIKLHAPYDLVSIAHMADGKFIDPVELFENDYSQAYISDEQWAISQLKSIRTQKEIATLLDSKSRELMAGRIHEGLDIEAQDIADKIIAIKERQTVVSWKTSKEVALEVAQSLRQDARKTGNINTGFGKLDRNIGVIKGGKLVSIAGRPGQGKTSIALDLIKHWCHSGIKVGFLSLEMSREEIYYALIAKFGQVSKDTFRHTAAITADQWALINEALENIASWPMIIYDKGNKNFDYLKTVIRRMVLDGAKVIIIDQLSRMEQRAESTRESYSVMVDALKNLAGALDVPIFMLCQINRESDKETDKFPKVWQLKNTGTIEETSDIILMVHLPYEYTHDTKDRCIANVIIGKNRNGATAMFKMAWSEPRCAFEEH